MKKQNDILFYFLFVLFLSTGITQAYASTPSEISSTQKEALRWVKQEFTDFKTALEKNRNSATSAENFEAIYQAALKTGLLDPEKLCQKKGYYSAFGRTDSDQLFLQSVHNEILRANSFFPTGYESPATRAASNPCRHNSNSYIIGRVPILIAMDMPSEQIESEVKVILCNNVQDVDEALINQLIHENPDAKEIRIWEYGDIKTDMKTNFFDKKDYRDDILPSSFWHTKAYGVKTTKSLLRKNRIGKDEFKFSVARGERVKLETDYRDSLQATINGEIYQSLNLKAAISCVYRKGTEYSGPSENSPYNTREFRIRFYEDYGKYTQTAKVVYTKFGTSIVDVQYNTKVTGTYSEPTKYVFYSIDMKY